MTTFIHLVRPIWPLLGAGSGAGFLFLAFFGLLEHRLHRTAARGANGAGLRPLYSAGGAPRNASGRAGLTNRTPAPVPSTPGQGALRSAALLTFPPSPEPGLVTVVIPSYNRAHIIGRAIESALGQTYHRIQVVVSDDGSVDDTRARAEGYGPRVTYIRQANGGVSAARNFGMRHARGEFIAFLDSDDEWKPWKIEAQLAALRRHPEAGAVWTDMSAVDDGGRVVGARHLREMYAAYRKIDIDTTLPPIGTLGELSPSVPAEFVRSPMREGNLYDSILLGNLVHTSTVLMRRSWVERTGGFDETFARAGEDYEFYVRLCSAGPVILLDAPSTIYRVGAADQLTRPAMLLEIARNNLRAVEKWIPHSTSTSSLPPHAIRRRYAEAYAWAGETELDAGHRWVAARRIVRSLAVMPRFDRRTLVLIRCGLPEPVIESLRGARRMIRGRVA